MPVSRRRRCGRAICPSTTPEELQLLVFLRFAGLAGAGHPDRYRHFPGHALQAGCRAERQRRAGRLRQRRVHHARRARGWLIRYMHSTGASAFFIVVYLHMFRGLLYGSYRKPRELTWLFGVGIFLVLMGEAFFGYLLAMGADVLLGRAGDRQPVLGDSGHRQRPCRSGSSRRLRRRRCNAEPLLLLPRDCLSRWCCSAWLLRTSWLCTKPVRTIRTGIEIKANKDENGIPLDGIPFHPYYTVKDIVGVVVFLMVFSA
jgi:ubiquinol-cytochrome c reductase cytochrome b subunit